ncbi:MAG: hypothetical protein IJZ72_00365 [Oscillospiraceae bacterium]|nr:hypothetical protein [Oscillospiraceae bacterium]
MEKKPSLVKLIIISLLCCAGIKALAALIGLFISGGAVITLLLSGLAAVIVVKKTMRCMVFPLTLLGVSLISDILIVRKVYMFASGTHSVYSLLDERVAKFVQDIGEYVGEGTIIGVAAVTGLVQLAATTGTFILMIIVSFIARYVISKKKNNNKNGGKENDQAYT